jgi:hypothetical protein
LAVGESLQYRLARVFPMLKDMVAATATAAPSESYTVEELYELQRRQGKLKSPVVSFEQRSLLKKKLGRQDSLDYSFVRSFSQVVHDFGSFFWNPLQGFNLGFSWIRYAFFGASNVDNIVSGRDRMARLRGSYRKNVRELMPGSYEYDPYKQVKQARH